MTLRFGPLADASVLYFMVSDASHQSPMKTNYA